jgi:hypothetical protein
MQNSEIAAITRKKTVNDQFFVSDINFYENRPKMRAIEVAGSLDSARFEGQHQLVNTVLEQQLKEDMLADQQMS